MKSKAQYCVFSLIFVLGCVSAFQAHAIDLQTIPKLKLVETMEEEAFNKETKLYSDTPFGDEFLAYEVRIPKDWTQGETYTAEKGESASVSLDILGNIARFDGPPRLDARSYFTLEALNLDYETTARSWFMNFILSNGYTIQGMDEISDRELNALYIYVEDDISYATRLAARINGPRIIVARYFVPLDDFEDEKIIQAQSMTSFKLTNTTGKQIEIRKTYDFLDQSHFDYPVSWQLNASDIMSIERMNAEIFSLSESEEMNGRIQIMIVSRLLDTSLSSEVTKFMDSFSIKNYELGSLIESHDFKHHPDMDFVKTQSYKLEPYAPTMMKYEYWASLLQNDDYYYIVTMLTPARNAEYFLWTKNVEAFRVVLSSIRRYE
ncbi:MAG: hypothetical protein AAF569_03430 [Pseudomonadota bacterium]